MLFSNRTELDGDRTFSFIVNELNNSFIGPIKKRMAVSSFKGISSAIDATNSSNNGFVFAKFDNVFINDQITVYENFSLSTIDPSKWRWPELVREAANGSLRANVQSADRGRNISTYLSEYDAPYLEAKVRINSDSQLSLGAFGFARIQGTFYNDSRGPGSGQEYNVREGDVLADVRLVYNSNGTLKAGARVFRTNDADQTNLTFIYDNNSVRLG